MEPSPSDIVAQIVAGLDKKFIEPALQEPSQSAIVAQIVEGLDKKYMNPALQHDSSPDERAETGVEITDEVRATVATLVAQLKIVPGTSPSTVQDSEEICATSFTTADRAPSTEAELAMVPQPEPAVLAKPESSATGSPIPRPVLFPMLKSTTRANDYSARKGLIARVRSNVEGGVSAAAMDAAANMFNPPAICVACEGAELTNLTDFLYHVTSDEHQSKIEASGGIISTEQCIFWLEILGEGVSRRIPV